MTIDLFVIAVTITTKRNGTEHWISIPSSKNIARSQIAHLLILWILLWLKFSEDDDDDDDDEDDVLLFAFTTAAVPFDVAADETSKIGLCVWERFICKANKDYKLNQMNEQTRTYACWWRRRWRMRIGHHQ